MLGVPKTVNARPPGNSQNIYIPVKRKIDQNTFLALSPPL